MFKQSKALTMLVSIGHAVLFSLAIVGAVRITCFLLGQPLSPEVNGQIFGISCLITVPIAAFFSPARMVTDQAPVKAK